MQVNENKTVVTVLPKNTWVQTRLQINSPSIKACKLVRPRMISLLTGMAFTPKQLGSIYSVPAVLEAVCISEPDRDPTTWYLFSGAKRDNRIIDTGHAGFHSLFHTIETPTGGGMRFLNLIFTLSSFVPNVSVCFDFYFIFQFFF